MVRTAMAMEMQLFLLNVDERNIVVEISEGVGIDNDR